MSTRPYAQRRDQLERPFGRMSRPLLAGGSVMIL
jgi:hypothetical protein